MLGAKGNGAARRTTEVVSVVGDLDARGGERVKKAIDDVVRGGRLDVTVNLDGVDVLDSAGLAALIVSLRRARERGGDIRVVATEPRIRKVLEVTALARVFKLQPMTDKAA